MDLPKVRGAKQGHACLSAQGRAEVWDSKGSLKGLELSALVDYSVLYLLGKRA